MRNALFSPVFPPRRDARSRRTQVGKPMFLLAYLFKRFRTLRSDLPRRGLPAALGRTDPFAAGRFQSRSIPALVSHEFRVRRVTQHAPCDSDRRVAVRPPAQCRFRADWSRPVAASQAADPVVLPERVSAFPRARAERPDRPPVSVACLLFHARGTAADRTQQLQSRSQGEVSVEPLVEPSVAIASAMTRNAPSFSAGTCMADERRATQQDAADHLHEMRERQRLRDHAAPAAACRRTET